MGIGLAYTSWLLIFLASSCGASSLMSAEPPLKKPATDPIVKIVAIGDSLTAGYGVASSDAYPVVLEKMLHDAGFTGVKVTNGGVSGATSAQARSRVDWILRSAPDIVILALGANDVLRGLKVEAMEKNLTDAGRRIIESGASLLLVVMRAPPNLGPTYVQKFEAAFPKIASELAIPLVPFLLEGVALEKDLNIADGLHPNGAGHRVMAKSVFAFLRPLVEKTLEKKRTSATR